MMHGIRQRVQPKRHGADDEELTQLLLSAAVRKTQDSYCSRKKIHVVTQPQFMKETGYDDDCTQRLMTTVKMIPNSWTEHEIKQNIKLYKC